MRVPFNIWILILFILPFIIRLGFDTYSIKKAKTKISKRGYLIRNTLTGGLIILAGVISKSYETSPPLWTAILFSFTLFFGLFDYSLNVARGLAWYYSSPDEHHNSVWERARQSMPPISEFFLK